jgi:hypothetical protein
VTQMMSTNNQLKQSEDQYAIWSFTGGPNPYGTNSSLVAAALAAVQSGFTGQGWEILTPTGSLGQEFLLSVAEPGTLAMLVVGLIALCVLYPLHRVLRLAPDGAQVLTIIQLERDVHRLLPVQKVSL